MKIKIYIILIVGIIYSNGVKAQNRNIYLVPGSGGDASMFNIYSNYLNTQFSGRATANTLGFNSSQSIQDIGTSLANGMTNNSQNIAVGQSMGGLLVRGIDNVTPNTKFGGLITMGTPNKGGAIFNNIQQAKDIINQGINEIIDIGVTAIDWVPLIGWIASQFNIGEYFRNQILTGFNRELDNQLNEKVPISLRQNLQENSTIINNLNNSNSNTFKIGVFGVENSPIHWRLLDSYLNNNPWNLPLNTTGDNERQINDIYNIRTEIVSWRNALASWYCDWWAWITLAPACFYLELALNDIRSEMQEAINWFDNSEAQWHQVIGAGGFYTEKRYITSIKPEYQQAINDLYNLLYEPCDGVALSIKDIGKIETNVGGGVSDACQQRWYDLFAQIRSIENDPAAYQQVLTDVQLPINYQSDGLFNAGSQRLPYDASNPNVVNVKVEGVNHAEFYNHPNVTNFFYNTFTGNQRDENQQLTSQFFNLNR